ncbi:MAG TPA: hypothetical protein PLV17_09540 [Spirochaetota bacterium]|jgi:hypothetical protein|nr:hypothetical protein [Spirochaetota bacterium]
MKKIIILILLFFAFSNIDSADIIAYPVPFDPSFQTLTVDDKSGEISGNVEINFRIYDIASDLVYSRKYNSFPIKWKGYNNKGGKIAAGFYIIKIDVINDLTGENYKKIIRILVKKK